MIENINGLYSGTCFIQTFWDLDLFITWILEHVAIYIILYNLASTIIYFWCFVIGNCKLVANYSCIVSYSCFTAAFSQSCALFCWNKWRDKQVIRWTLDKDMNFAQALKRKCAMKIKKKKTKKNSYQLKFFWWKEGVSKAVNKTCVNRNWWRPNQGFCIEQKY